MNTGNHWLLSLTSNSSANTKPVLKRCRVCDQNLIKTRCFRQREKIKKEKGGGGKKEKMKTSPHPPKSVIPPPPKSLKTLHGHQSTAEKPTSTILPFVNTQTGKSRLESVANRIETSDSASYTNYDIPTTKTSLVLGLYSPCTEQDSNPVTEPTASWHVHMLPCLAEHTVCIWYPICVIICWFIHFN